MVLGASLVALLAVALSCLLSGIALLLAHRTRVSGGLLVAGGFVGLVGAVLAASGETAPGRPVLVAAGAVLLPLALMTYPRVHWQHPVDALALVVSTIAGAAAVTQATNASALGSLGIAIVGTLLAHTWWRLERTSGEERRAVQWMALAVGVSALMGATLGFAWEGYLVSELAVGLLVVIGPALYLGVAASEVVDVRVAVVGAVVTVTALLGYTAVFICLATLLELTANREPEVGALALVGALAALTLHPLQVLLRGVVDQLLDRRRRALVHA